MNNKCTLHKLVEQLDSNNVYCSELVEKAARPLFDLIEKKAPEAMCFYMGNQSHLSELSGIPELAKLPFDTCWFECDVTWDDAGPGRVAYFCFNIENGLAVNVFNWDKSKSAWSLIESAEGGYENLPTSITMRTLREEDAPIAQTMQLAALLFAYLSYINCSNVKRTKINPTQAIQKARRKRGKKPLFSYWILDIPSGEDADKGGWNTAPRSLRTHLRRGHARKFKSGKWCWVRACMVGGGDEGIVHKQYSTPTPKRPPPKLGAAA